MKTNLKTNLLIIALILGCLGIGYAWYDSSQKQKQELAMHIKLEKALTDTIRVHQNESGEWVTEKLTLQGDIDDLSGMVGGLNDEKQELVNRIKKTNKQKEVIAAALFSATATIDSLLNTEAIVINDSTLAFSDSTEHYNYNISVGNIQPFKDYRPYLSLNRFSVPTDYFVSFNWDKNKREQYPVSFNVTPTNPYIRVTSVESYAIPQLQKQIVKPTGWKKFGNFFKDRWQDLLIGGVSFGVGYGLGASQ